MNPKAAYLALHGAIPKRWGGKWYRITVEGQQHLRYISAWRIARADYYNLYLEIAWEEIPDDVLGLLSWEMIHSFIDG